MCVCGVSVSTRRHLLQFGRVSGEEGRACGECEHDGRGETDLVRDLRLQYGEHVFHAARL